MQTRVARENHEALPKDQAAYSRRPHESCILGLKIEVQTTSPHIGVAGESLSTLTAEGRCDSSLIVSVNASVHTLRLYLRQEMGPPRESQLALVGDRKICCKRTAANDAHGLKVVAQPVTQEVTSTTAISLSSTSTSSPQSILHINPSSALGLLHTISTVSSLPSVSCKTSAPRLVVFIMYLPSSLIFPLLASLVSAKHCQTFSVPVTVLARNGVFNVPTLRNNHDATTFFANFTNPAGNFSNEVLLGYQTINHTYDISVKFCRPNAGYGPDPTVQFLTHGIGFDKK